MFKNIKDYTVNDMVDDTALIKEVTSITCSNGKQAYFLSCVTADGTFNAKVWDASLVDNFGVTNIAGKPFILSGVVTEYKGVKEVKVDGLAPSNEPLSSFVKSLDIDTLSKEFISILRNNVSTNAFKVVSLVFDNDKGVGFERFVKSVAAAHYHDNVIGGLINHTTKMLKILKVVIDNDARLDIYKDILFIGVALHDVGKIYEYTELGEYAELGFADHKAFGIEILSSLKKEIIDLIGERNYYMIISIILGHHGEYGEPCHSVPAQVVHLIDMLDAKVTGMLQSIDEVSEGVKTISCDGRKLAF